jgi:hypothetical protein
MDEVHRPGLIGSRRRAAVFSQLGLDPAFRRLVAQLQAHLAKTFGGSRPAAEAADYWRHYLANDRQSEWAARARRSLKFCEMQVNLIASA